MNNIDPEHIKTPSVSSEQLPLPDPKPSGKRTPSWVWYTVIAVVALLAGLLIGKAVIPPEVVTETKTVTKEVVPKACHTALAQFDTKTKALDSQVYSYKDLVDIIQEEMNGNPSPKSVYETLGLTVGLNQGIIDEADSILMTAIPECNKHL